MSRLRDLPLFVHHRCEAHTAESCCARSFVRLSTACMRPSLVTLTFPCLFVLLPLLLLLLLLPISSHSLTVHLVPHTHDDVGWLQTVDQYYVRSVQYILSSVIPQLHLNPSRRFIYVEQAFFQRWWRQQTEAMQEMTRQVVANGQLEFINGGWAMHDEGCTHYVDMIDQTTLGHRFIVDHFGAVANPTIGWQIDPFGHSATQAALLSAEVGFDGLFFGRLAYQERAVREVNRTLEMLWRGSRSFEQTAEVFTGILATDNVYGPPNGFCFDMRACNGGTPVQADPALSDYNLDAYVALFEQRAWEQSRVIQGEHLMWTLGSDFQWTNAVEYFHNLDTLIEAVNAAGNVTALYSTPSIYVRAKNAENLTLSLKTDDFFPYIDDPHSTMVGFLTSRPALKGFVRSTSSFLQLARQVAVYTAADGSAMDRLAEAQGVLQHHDGVSGSSKQAVADDYAQRLSRGIDEAEAFIEDTLATLIRTSNSTTAVEFEDCPLMNVSLCPKTADPNSPSLVVLILNPLAHPRTELITLPTTDSDHFVLNSSGVAVISTVLPVFNVSAMDQQGQSTTVSFLAELPALGYATYFLLRGEAAQRAAGTFAPVSDAPQVERQRRGREVVSGGSHVELHQAASNLTIENEVWLLTFNSSGLPVYLTNKTSGERTNFTMFAGWYQSFYDNDTSRSSGAYIFRPQQVYAHPIADASQVRLSIVSAQAMVDPDDPTTNVTAEARMTLADWAQLTVRLVSGSSELFVDYSIGPIPIEDGLGKEVIVRYQVGVDNGAEWWTDANGREMQKRTKDHRPSYSYNATDEPVSSNYFPVNAWASISDSERSFSVLPDRSHGCSSLASGQLELMLHRRLLHDDHYGVGEALNETETRSDGTRRGLTIAGTHRLLLSAASQMAVQAREVQSRVFARPHVLLATLVGSAQRFISRYRTSASFLATPLPSSIDLVTLQPWRNSSVLVRLAHRHGVEEGTAVSAPVTLDVTRLFTWPVVRVEALSLTANAPAGSHQKMKWRVQGEKANEGRVQGGLVNSTLTITAAEIHTLAIWFNRTNG